MRKLADRHRIRKRRFEVDPEYRDSPDEPRFQAQPPARKRRSAPGSSLTVRMSREGRTLGGDSSGSSGREGKLAKSGKKGPDLALNPGRCKRTAGSRRSNAVCAGMCSCYAAMSEKNERHEGNRRERRR